MLAKYFGTVVFGVNASSIMVDVSADFAVSEDIFINYIA